MKNNWLAASNFERMHQIISAINMISIRAKLKLAGIDEPIDEMQLDKARMDLEKFLVQFDALVHEVERSQDGIVVGDDPRLGELTVQYLSEKRRELEPSGLYNVSLSDLTAMIRSEHIDQLPQIISCLRELRELLEQNSQADIRDILGDI